MVRPIETKKARLAKNDKRTRLARAMDAAIKDLFPGWGVKRAESRARLKLWSAYENARTTRLNKSRTSRGGTADRHMTATTLYNLREACRDLDRNNTLAKGILSTDVDNAIGQGHKPQAMSDDEQWNEEAETWFNERWATDLADVTGRMNFLQMQRVAYRSMRRDGDIGFALLNGGLSAVEADCIASPKDKQEAPVINGVEVNKLGRPVAYYVADEHPTSSYVSSATRIAAKDFIHVAMIDRFTQTRGRPVMTPVIDDLDRLDDTVEAVVIAHQMAACFGLARKFQEGYGEPTGTTEENPHTGDDELVNEYEPGMEVWLQQGEDLVQIKPEHPGQQFDTVINTLARFCGRHMGFPLELVMLNFSQSNFSNTRAALLQAFRTWECIQGFWGGGFLPRVWRYAVSWGMKHGELRPLAPERRPWRHKWIGPGWVWVDKLKDLQADILALHEDMTTLDRLCAKYDGGDRETIRRQRLRELKAQRELDPHRAAASKMQSAPTVMETEPAGKENGDAE